MGREERFLRDEIEPKVLRRDYYTVLTRDRWEDRNLSGSSVIQADGAALTAVY